MISHLFLRLTWGTSEVLIQVLMILTEGLMMLMKARGLNLVQLRNVAIEYGIQLSRELRVKWQLTPRASTGLPYRFEFRIFVIPGVVVYRCGSHLSSLVDSLTIKKTSALP